MSSSRSHRSVNIRSQASSGSKVSVSALMRRLASLEKQQTNWADREQSRLLLIRMKHWVDAKLERVNEVVPDCSPEDFAACLQKLSESTAYEKDAKKLFPMRPVLTSVVRYYPLSGGISAQAPKMAVFLREFLGEAIAHPTVQSKRYLTMSYIDQNHVMKEVLRSTMHNVAAVGEVPQVMTTAQMMAMPMQPPPMLRPDDSVSQILGVRGGERESEERRRMRKEERRARKLAQKQKQKQNHGGTIISKKNRYRDRGLEPPPRSYLTADDMSTFSVAQTQVMPPPAPRSKVSVNIKTQRMTRANAKTNPKSKPMPKQRKRPESVMGSVHSRPRTPPLQPEEPQTQSVFSVMSSSGEEDSFSD